jgi:hypothetical protein
MMTNNKNNNIPKLNAEDAVYYFSNKTQKNSNFDEVLIELEIYWSDYEFCRSRREQYEKKSRKWGFVMLELKQLMKTKKLNGKIYNYYYIKPTHPDVKNYYGKTYSDRYKCPYYQRDITEIYNYENKKYYKMDKTDDRVLPFNCIYEYNNSSHPAEIRNMIKSISKDMKPDYNKQTGYIIRKRFLYKTLDYNLSNNSNHHPTNLKYWDKTTMKTSNRGLKATNAYTYENYDGNACGWTFGGISSDDISKLCCDNGYKKVKGVRPQYGDYANWYLHILE